MPDCAVILMSGSREKLSLNCSATPVRNPFSVDIISTSLNKQYLVVNVKYNKKLNYFCHCLLSV